MIISATKESFTNVNFFDLFSFEVRCSDRTWAASLMLHKMVNSIDKATDLNQYRLYSGPNALRTRGIAFLRKFHMEMVVQTNGS